MDFENIKYYPEKFFIRFDSDNIENLVTMNSNGQYSIELAAFIHEYYHYLTNISTFQGLRAFNACFQDKIRIVTRVQKRCNGLDGFPLFNNNRDDCAASVNYWKGIDEIDTGDSILRPKAIEIHNSPSHKVTIKNVSKKQITMEVELEDRIVKGEREMIYLTVDGIVNNEFSLPIAAIDEFLSSSIDQYLYETDASDNLDIIRDRPFYPYMLFDELLHYYGLDWVEAKYKIIIAYKAIHGNNPVVNLIDIIEAIALTPDEFYANPFDFLEDKFHVDEYALLHCPCMYNYTFIKECLEQKRINLSNALSIVYEYSRHAAEHLKIDSYYFIRPLLENDMTTQEGRQKYLYFLKDLLGEFKGFIQLKNDILIDAYSDSEKNHLAFILAVYEILKGSESQRIVERTVTTYKFDGDPTDCDKLANLPTTLPLTAIWHIALNDLSFYKLYLEEKNRIFNGT